MLLKRRWQSTGERKRGKKGGEKAIWMQNSKTKVEYVERGQKCLECFQSSESGRLRSQEAADSFPEHNLKYCSSDPRRLTSVSDPRGNGPSQPKPYQRPAATVWTAIQYLLPSVSGQRDFQFTLLFCHNRFNRLFSRPSQSPEAIHQGSLKQPGES